MTRHMLIALVVHDDGSISSRDWVTTSERVEDTVAGLGPPTFAAFLPAGEVTTFAPRIAGASVVVDQREQT